MARIGTGIEVRDTSIRLKFILDGETIKERITLNGKPLAPTPANIKHATRLAVEIKRQIAQGTFNYAEFFPDSPRAQSDVSTFAQMADLWLDSKGRLEDATKDQYRNAIAVWKGIFEGMKMRDLTYPVLSGKIGKHPWASAKSANNYLIALRGVFSMEYHGRRAADNPMVGIKNFPVVKKLPDPLTPDERDSILEGLQRYDPRVVAYFTFAFYTGMRPEEMIALQWGDIDYMHKSARVQRVRTFRGTERDGSKTHTERDVDLTAPALHALSVMKPYTYLKGGDIFENPVTGSPWHDERSQRDHYWKPTLKRLGIRERSAYNTRHTYATVALMAGVKPAYIAQQLGPTNTKMLFEKYARWITLADKGQERLALEAAFKSHERPADQDGQNETRSKHLSCKA